MFIIQCEAVLSLLKNNAVPSSENRLLIGMGLECLPTVLAFDEAVHVKAIKELIKHAYKLGCLLGILSSCHL